MTLPELAIRRPVTTAMLLVSILVLGLLAIARLPLAFMPEVERPALYVIAEYPNASPETVERNIIRPLEEELGSLKGLERVWSRCDQQGGRVNVTFRWGTDLDAARAEIRERVDRMRDDLPDDLERLQISPHWNPRETGETIMEGRISSARDLSRDYELLERKIVRPLERIAGVAQVTLDGVNPREVRIDLRLDALSRHRVDIREVMSALAENNQDRALGVVRKGDRRILLRSLGRFREIDEIRQVAVSASGIRLEDVAVVTFAEPPLEYGRHLDRQFAIGVSVTKEPSANTVTISEEIRARVAAMDADPDLSGIRFLVWEDQGKEIRKTLADLRHTGVLGGILASIMLFLFLRRVRPTLIVVACIPFSVIAACAVVWARGATLNTLTLLGLIVGIGMLVDNAVVVMENIHRYREKGMSGRVAALFGSREVSVAITAATLTSIIVFLPIIFSRPNEMNLYLRELGLTICFTLVASLFISQTLIPLAMARSRTAALPGTSRFMSALRRRYVRALDFTLDHRWIAPLAGIAVMASAVVPYRGVEKNFDVSSPEMFVGVRYILSEELPLDRKEALINRAEEVLDGHREEFHIRSIYSFWNERWMITRLYMEEGHTHEEEMNRIRRGLQEVVPKIPGVRLQVQDSRPFWQRNRGKRVAFQLRGEDTGKLAELADEARQLLEGVDGLFDFYSSADGGKLEVETRIDRDRARAYGVPVDEPGQIVGLTFRGRRLPRFLGPDGEVEMELALDEGEVTNLHSLHDLPLPRGGAAPVPLASVAEFAVVKGPDDIQRDDRVTGVWVGARYEEGQKEEHAAAARAALEEMALPYGYSWDFDSFRRDSRESQREFFLNLLLALGLIFGVMASLFESARQAVSLMISLPFAVAGALWMLYFTGTDFDQPASVGLFLLLGVVVNNGIVMIEHINGYRRSGMARRDSMLRGGAERLRPVLMTAATTLLGLIPIVVRKPALGGVYYYSMALVLIGGLAVSTVLTSLLLPTTVCITEDALGKAGGLVRRVVSRRAGRRLRKRQDPGTA